MPTSARGAEGAKETISVVLPVHRGVEASHFREALASVKSQTRPADEIVVVEDGPLTGELLTILDELASSTRGVLRVRLVANGGPGIANGAGLSAASGTWIAKADADDINRPNRLQTQLDAVGSFAADVCGASMGEFSDDPELVEGNRPNPATHKDIARRLRWNNPINHPTAFYRRALAVDVGGYRAMRHMEDYDLMARMWAAGGRFVNLEDELVLFRANRGMYARRKTLLNHQMEWELQSNLRRYGVTSRTQRVRNLVLRTGYRLLPEMITTRTHRAMFRRVVLDDPPP